MPKKVKDKTVAYILDRYEKYQSDSSDRLGRYTQNEKWFQGDKTVQYGETKGNWQPTVIANVIESNIRTLVAVLTDSNPIMRVHSFPLVSPESLGPDVEESLTVFSQNNDLVLNHIWRVNDMRRKLRKIVLDGCVTGLKIGRAHV